ADTWAEQRVLMRAFATCRDQTRPTVELHGAELPIGPAGDDPHGAWGIHVEPPVDGRAQALRDAFELAARRLAGSRGNPPRLADEAAGFETRPTGTWAPGVSPKIASGLDPERRPYEPAEVAPPAGTGATAASRPPAPADPATGGRAGGEAFDGRRTAQGYAPGPAGTAPPSIEAGPAATESSFAHLVGRTMPLGVSLEPGERAVLDALGRGHHLHAGEIAALTGVADGAAWMDAFASKLASHGLDLVGAGTACAERPTCALRR